METTVHYCVLSWASWRSTFLHSITVSYILIDLPLVHLWWGNGQKSCRVTPFISPLKLCFPLCQYSVYSYSVLLASLITQMLLMTNSLSWLMAGEGWRGEQQMVSSLEHYHPNHLWNFFHALGIIVKVISFTAFFKPKCCIFLFSPICGDRGYLRKCNMCSVHKVLWLNTLHEEHVQLPWWNYRISAKCVRGISSETYEASLMLVLINQI